MRQPEEWLWGAPSDEPAGDRFIIEPAPTFWARVRTEIDRDEDCSWMRVNKPGEEPDVADILDMMLTVVPTYLVNHNRFVIEAARIPAFAQFLRSTRADLCNYVSNSLHPDVPTTRERYSDEVMRRLVRVVSGTLDIDDDWY